MVDLQRITCSSLRSAEHEVQCGFSVMVTARFVPVPTVRGCLMLPCLIIGPPNVSTQETKWQVCIQHIRQLRHQRSIQQSKQVKPPRQVKETELMGT